MIRILLEGVVQGVGFRPFVKRLADRFGLSGVTFNTASGLVIEIDAGEETALLFLKALRAEAPPAARIERVSSEQVPHQTTGDGFSILSSPRPDGTFTLTSPDLATCSDCLREISDPNNRRYQYAFTNCTNCGPRYSITLSTPYDRANTTMRQFTMCAECASEYSNPADRRFHAEPIACPACGPRLSMCISDAIGLLASGSIIALKGLGGFQLACDAFNTAAVELLRTRKRRVRNPFAVMMRDPQTVERFCVLDHSERNLLSTPEAPVVLLAMRDSAGIPEAVAPGLRRLGVMLPYTPLHHLLFTGPIACLVMTSGNLSEEPIVTRNQEAEAKLAPLANHFLHHDRGIFMRVDDSVARVFEGIPRVLRRARGYAPRPIPLAREMPEVLATGAELKNTFCITKGRYAIPSQHIGDMENFETLQFFEETLRNLQSVYRSEPKLIAHDLHPDYLTTRWARERGLPTLGVQHHHAHIASCMAENGVEDQVIGVAFDGAGYGDDGQVWGGEFLLCDYRGYRRAAHLRYVALPGGDRAAREGWRMAAAHLHDALGSGFRRIELPCWKASQRWNLLDKILAQPLIRTSSCGRLFDAVSAICGISLESSYEGESAMLLEAAAQANGENIYEIPLDTQTEPWTLDTRPMMQRIVHDVTAGSSPRLTAGCFHSSLAHMIESVCSKLRDRSGVDKVCLSGGTFQNFTLLAGAAARLRTSGFQVSLHSQVPPNDGGISLGQAAIAAGFLSDRT